MKRLAWSIDVQVSGKSVVRITDHSLTGQRQFTPDEEEAVMSGIKGLIGYLGVEKAVAEIMAYAAAKPKETT